MLVVMVDTTIPVMTMTFMAAGSTLTLLTFAAGGSFLGAVAAVGDGGERGGSVATAGAEVQAADQAPNPHGGDAQADQDDAHHLHNIELACLEGALTQAIRIALVCLC
jgi:hypothetical protein